MTLDPISLAIAKYKAIIIAVGFAAALALGFSVGFKMNGWRLGAEISDLKASQAKEQTKAAEEKAKAIQTANSETQRLQEIKDEALRKANQRAAQNQSAADSARSELDRLRDDIATSDRNAPACTTGANPAATARALLAECAARYSDLASKADRHSTDAVTLYQAWPK